MIRSLWIAKTGMEGQQTKLDTISNNLANVGTNGFKRGGVVFEDLMYQNLRQVGAASSDQTQLPTGLQVGLGTRVSASTRNFSQGNLQQTGNNLDLAIKGQGFFQIQLPDGSTAYTRDGSFQVDGSGQMVTANGHVLQPGITIPANAQSVTIAADGTVNVTLPAQAAPQSVGQLQLASFINPAGLDPRGQNLYAETAASGAAQHRRARHRRPRRADAGLRRGQQRQRGRGAGVDDRHAARLRAQLQGDPDLRPDAAGWGSCEPMTSAVQAAARRRRRLGTARCGLVAALCAALGGCVTMNPRVEVAEPTP